MYFQSKNTLWDVLLDPECNFGYEIYFLHLKIDISS